MRTQLLRGLFISIVWVVALLLLAFFYPDIVDYTLRTIPYSFLFLAPFGWNSFLGWAMAFAVSFWALHTLKWDELPLYFLVKGSIIVTCSILLIHAIWVAFVVARGGI